MELNYIIANNPDRLGSLHTTTVGELDEILTIASVYFEIAELFEHENINKVMIQYE